MNPAELKLARKAALRLPRPAPIPHRTYRRRGELPTGIYPVGKRFAVRRRVAGKNHGGGTHDTLQAALEALEKLNASLA